MKIFQITTFFHPVYGGVEDHVLNLSKELISKGHEVEVLTSDSNKDGPRIKEKSANLSGIKITRFFTWFGMSYFHKFFPGILLYLLRNDFDIIHIHGFRKIESYFALIISKIRKKKVILTTHNPFVTVAGRSKLSSFLLKIHDKTYGKLLVKYFDKIIYLVGSEQKILTDEFGVKKEKTERITNGVQKEFFEAGDSEKFYEDWEIKKERWDAIVTGVGRVNYTKGYQNLELAAKKLERVLFVFTGGDDGYLKELKILYRNYKNVLFTERFLSKPQLIDLFSAADVFALPSLNEPFGIVLLEALASGLPIISSDTGGPKEFLNEKYTEFVSPEDKEGWVKAIKYVLEDEERREDMKKLGKVAAEKYKWPKVANQVVKCYESVIY